MKGAVRISGSLRTRLLLQLLGSAAVMAAIVFLTVSGFVRDVAEESHDSILAASATSIMDSVSVNAGVVTVDLPYAALSMLGNVSDDRVFYRVSSDGRALTGYQDLPADEAAAPSGAPVFRTLDYKGDTIRMVTVVRLLSVDGAPTPVAVSVAQTQTGQTAILARLSRSALSLGVGFFLLASGLAIWATRSSIRPLQSLAQAVSRRGPKDLRPVTRPVPTEMAPLVSSLNSFIERLGASLSRSEDFIAEAAHRVRTPLATVRTQAEITLRRVEKEENRTSLREMIRAIDESSRASGQLLDHAMVSFRTDSLERVDVDLADLVSDLVERLRPVAELKDIDLDFASTEVPRLSGDPILIQNAVRNILDNAIKYSPSDRCVSIRVSGDADGGRVSIEDQAGGFGQEDTAALTRRFVRGDNTKGIVGSGLGLTIAREVAEAHGGTLSIDNNNSGTGACVSLHFPYS